MAVSTQAAQLENEVFRLKKLFIKANYYNRTYFI